MRIWISKEDIKNGVPRSATNCPISLALNRKFKYCSRVTVTRAWTTIRIDDKKYIYKNSKKTTHNIDNFDNNQGMTPGYVYLKESESD